MNNFKKYILVVILLIPLISGCGLAYRVLLGVDPKPDWNSDKEIRKQAKNYNIPSEYNFVMDTASYYEGLTNIYQNLFDELPISEKESLTLSKFNKVLQDDAQVVHFRMFDNTGAEIFKIVNCYVDPPIPMNWNVDGCFDTFPPKIGIETLNTHNYDLVFLLSNASSLSGTKVTLNELPQANYYGVIIWNEVFKRPSKKLIKTVRKNLHKTDESVVLIFINNQNAYLWQVMDSESKEKVKMYDNTQATN